MQNGLFDHRIIRYEIALGVVGAQIAQSAERLGEELARTQPDPSVIQRLEQRQRELNAVRDALHPHDMSGIDNVIRQYGPAAREDAPL